MSSRDQGKTRTVIGFMTGTSIDAVDAALVRIEGNGLAMQATVVACFTEPIGDEREILFAASRGEPVTGGDLAQASHALSERHAKMARRIIHEHGDVDCVVVHGQTIYHAPPISLQVIEPATIARAARAPVVSDLRAADLAAGGQGAPITPIADWILFRSEQSSRAIVNLGGFCNVTILPAHVGPESVTGADVCACNQVLDAVARLMLKAPYDEGGNAALRGEPDPQSTAELGSLLGAQRDLSRSLGAGDEATDWVEAWLSRLTPEDFAASAVDAIASVVTEGFFGVDEAYVAGGGCHNQALFKAIMAHATAPVRRTDELGVAAPFREAVAMAILGALCADGVPITLPQVTRVPSPASVAGSWTNLPHPLTPI